MRRRLCLKRTRNLHPCKALAFALALVSWDPAFAAKTAAGTSIVNTATAKFDLPGGGTSTVTSNTVTLRVDELLDVAVGSQDAGDVAVMPAATNQVLSYKITNAGNGSEAFALVAKDTLTGDDFDPTTTSIVIDSNGNGTYDPGTDTVYVAGSNDPVVAPDGSVVVFVLSSIPTAATNSQRGRVDLVATAVTGTGAPGTAFAGKGQGGGDAVVGATTAQASARGYYAVQAASVTFVKSATVADPFGGTSQVPGSTITYNLVATVNGTGSLANLTVSDTVPAGTSYVAGSLTSLGTALSDAADGDAGEVVSNAVAVRLGTVAAGSSQTVKFQVKVN